MNEQKEGLGTELLVYLDRLALLEAPANQEKVAEIIAYLGNFPSIETIEEVVSFYKKQVESIKNQDIPALMAEYNQRKAEMLDGTKIEITNYLGAKQLDKMALIEWLNDNGYSDIVKEVFSFGKGEDLNGVIEDLERLGISYDRAIDVNTNSLKKVIRDHLEAGGERPPEDAVELRMFETAIIKRPKGGNSEL